MITPMNLTTMLTRSSSSRPGIVGTVRTDRDINRLLQRLNPGDIAVIDILDLDRITADALVDARVSAVVNASPSISGRYPNLGPEVLVANGITLIDSIGPEVFKRSRTAPRSGCTTAASTTVTAGSSPALRAPTPTCTI